MAEGHVSPLHLANEGEELGDFKSQLIDRLHRALAHQGLPTSSSLEEMAEKKKELEYRRSLLEAIIALTENELKSLASMEK